MSTDIIAMDWIFIHREIFKTFSSSMQMKKNPNITASKT
jgi:hypothetical protein